MKWILSIIATLLAAVMAVYWAIFFWPVSVLSNPDESEKEIIERTVSFYICNPDWIEVEQGEDKIFIWLFAETKVRLLVVFIAWIGTLISIISLPKKGANQTRMATA